MEEEKIDETELTISTLKREKPTPTSEGQYIFKREVLPAREINVEFYSLQDGNHQKCAGSPKSTAIKIRPHI